MQNPAIPSIPVPRPCTYILSQWKTILVFNSHHLESFNCVQYKLKYEFRISEISYSLVNSPLLCFGLSVYVYKSAHGCGLHDKIWCTMIFFETTVANAILWFYAPELRFSDPFCESTHQPISTKHMELCWLNEPIGEQESILQSCTISSLSFN